MKVTRFGDGTKKVDLNEDIILKWTNDGYSPISGDFPSIARLLGKYYLVIPEENYSNSGLDVTLNDQTVIWGVNQIRLELRRGDVIVLRDDSKKMLVTMRME